MKNKMIQTPVGKLLLRCNCNSNWNKDFEKNGAVCVAHFDSKSCGLCPTCRLNYWVNSPGLYKRFIMKKEKVETQEESLIKSLIEFGMRVEKNTNGFIVEFPDKTIVEKCPTIEHLSAFVHGVVVGMQLLKK